MTTICFCATTSVDLITALPFAPSISIEAPRAFNLGGITHQVASWRVAWGDGQADTLQAGVRSATHEYWPPPSDTGVIEIGGTPPAVALHTGSLTLFAETGESLTSRIDFSTFNLTTDGVLHAGNRFTDVMAGGSGADSLFGGRGDDSLQGGLGNDLLIGGDGNDLLLGNGGANTLTGGNGADTLLAGPGDDRLVGGNGDDWLGHWTSPFDNGVLHGLGSDRLNGGDGADTLIASIGGTAALQLGPDDDADVVLLPFSSAYDRGTPDGIASFDTARDRVSLKKWAPFDLELVIGPNPQAAADRWAVLYDTSSGRLHVDVPDNLGYADVLISPVHVATFWDAPLLTAANFVF